MKKWVVRFIAVYLYNVIVLFAIGLLFGSVAVGIAALWASLILTLATLLLKRGIHALFQGRAKKSMHKRTKVGESVLQFVLVYAVALIIWLLVVLLSGVSVSGLFWWWFAPPLVLLLGWALYDTIAEKVEARGGDMYDKALGGRAAPAPDDTK